MSTPINRLAWEITHPERGETPRRSFLGRHIQTEPNKESEREKVKNLELDADGAIKDTP